jgi:hypothetical protein
MTGEEIAQECPMPSAHRRLMDGHAQWHRLHENYFDPHGFRIMLNALVPNLRNVTWLLQKQKKELAGFDQWYPRFQQQSGNSEIMRWVVKSRNRITKEADLELHSELQIVWQQNWLQRVLGASAKFPPRMSVREILDDVVRRYRPPGGTVTVRRRWVDAALPEWELLDATGEAYAQLAALLAEGHRAAGVQVCDLSAREEECVTAHLSSSGTRPHCMLVAKDDLEAHFDVLKGVQIESYNLTIERDKDGTRLATERYGQQPEPHPGDPIASVPWHMANARRLMEKDGFHTMFVFLYRGETMVQFGHLDFDSQGTKILSFEKLANQVNALKADGVVVTSESWFAKPTRTEQKLGTVLIPPRDRLDRLEALTVYAATRDGRRAGQMSLVTRGPARQTTCSDPQDAEYAVEHTLAPVLRMWEETAQPTG